MGNASSRLHKLCRLCSSGFVKVFYRRGLIETWGRGTLKIATLMQTVGLPLPTIHEHTGSVLMTFMLPKQLGGVSEGVSALVALIKQHQGMRVPALAEVLNTSPKNLERWLKQLREAGQIEFIGSPKTGGYYPK